MDECKQDLQGANGRRGGLSILAFTFDQKAIPAQDENQQNWKKKKLENAHLTELSAQTFSAYFAFSVFVLTRLYIKK